MSNQHPLPPSSDGPTQYGALPGSYGIDPASMSYQRVSPTTVANHQQRRQSLKFVIISLATILLGCAVYFLRDLFEYGTPLLMLRLAESAAGLVLALSFFLLLPFFDAKHSQRIHRAAPLSSRAT